jgi:hypothetical protein
MKIKPRFALRIIALCIIALAALFACATTRITSRQTGVQEELPRPGRILVYDFAASAADIPADSPLADRFSGQDAPPTAEEMAAGRELGAGIATRLVEEIRGMGLPALRASAQAAPQVDDIVIRGYLLSIEEGSAAKRVAIGFRSGGSELQTAVEAYQMTPQGLRKLGAGEVESKSGKTPGVILGLATKNPLGVIVSGAMKLRGEKTGSSTIEGRAEKTAKEIGDQLRKAFEQQGWVK